MLRVSKKDRDSFLFLPCQSEKQRAHAENEKKQKFLLFFSTNPKAHKAKN